MFGSLVAERVPRRIQLATSARSPKHHSNARSDIKTTLESQSTAKASFENCRKAQQAHTCTTRIREWSPNVATTSANPRRSSPPTPPAANLSASANVATPCQGCHSGRLLGRAGRPRTQGGSIAGARRSSPRPLFSAPTCHPWCAAPTPARRVVRSMRLAGHASRGWRHLRPHHHKPERPQVHEHGPTLMSAGTCLLRTTRPASWLVVVCISPTSWRTGPRSHLK